MQLKMNEMQFMIILQKLLESIRSKCEWYEHDEISIKFFLNLEKQSRAQNTIKKLVLTIRKLQTRYTFFPFKRRKQKTAAEIRRFLGHLNIPKLPEDKSKLWEEDLTEKDLYDSLKNMQNDKFPGNDVFPKEFYETFWNELKEIFLDSVLEAKEK